MRVWLALVLIAVPVHAHGQADGPPPGPPRPGQESGRIDEDDGDSSARVLTRGALFLPRLVLQAAILPGRGAIWVYDRYQLAERYYRVFCSDDRTFCVVPTFDYQTGFGTTAGASLTDSNTFGAHEGLSARAIAGLSYRADLRAALDSGRRFGPLRLELAASFERHPDEVFYGLGNADLAASPPPMADPRAVAFETYHRYRASRATLAADLAATTALHVVARAAVEQHHAMPSTDGTSIETVFDPTGLVGFGAILDQLYPELELCWDDRRAATRWEPTHVHTVGSLARGYLGRVIQDGRDFWHYGGELQHYWRLGMAPRVLSVRLAGEAVSGGLGDVPYYELPALGGDAFLRGYGHGRFRDRIAAFGSVQYAWDLSRYADAYLFVDAGRVYRDASELDAGGLRAGYGVGIVLHSDGGFLFETAIASSIDGGVTVSLSLNPVLDRRRRWR